jgi:hypothetical protein
MAQRFPFVHFEGIDIGSLTIMFLAIALIASTAPIMTRYPPENANFVIADFNQRLDYEDESFHLVHAREISLGVCE